MDDRRVLVAIRVRPKLEAAIAAVHQNERYSLEAAAKTSDCSVRLSDGKTGRDGKTHNFTYDLVFDKDSTQLDVYEETTLDAVDAVLQGCNATIVTYGQTGSGKTYTVLGSVKKNPLTNDIITADTGLFLRALKDILSYAETRCRDMHVVVGLSVLEIYLDEVRDLLSNEATPPTLNVSVIRDTLSIPGMTYKPIQDLNDAVNAYKLANARRVSRATSSNDTSSRSHAVFSIELFQQPRTESNPDPLEAKSLCELREKYQLQLNTASDVPTPLAFSRGTPQSSSMANPSFASPTIPSPATPTQQQGSAAPQAADYAGFGARASNPLLTIPGQPPIMFSKLVLTDLAGSEKLKNSRVRGDGLEELKKINASLTALGNVVHSLYQGAKHIPYRDSKLTILLRESFASPNSKIVMIANVSPTVLTFDETLSTMFFADKVKGMKVENPQAADVAKLELEYLGTMKHLEEIATDLRIAKEAYDIEPVIRRRGHPQLVDVHLGVVKRANGSQLREKDVKFLYEPALQLCRDAQQRRKDQLAVECAEVAQTTKAEAIDAYKATRSRLTSLIAQLDAEKQRDAGEYAQIERETEEEIAREQQEADVLSRELHSLQPKALALPAAKSSMDAQLLSLNEKIDIMERKIFESNRETEEAWEKHQALHAKREQQFATSSRFAESCTGLWKAKYEYTQERRDHLQLMADISTAKYESETMDVTMWIRAAVTRIARNAVAVAVSKGRKAPSTRPVARSFTGMSRTSSTVGGADRRVDPEAGMSEDSDAQAASAEAARQKQNQKRRCSLYDQPTLIGEILSYAQYGCKMLKYGRSGAPHYRVFYILTSDDGTSRLCWDEEDDGSRLGKGSTIPLESVVRVILGQFTPIFRRIPGNDGFYTSFSIEYISRQQTRTLDLVCDTDAELESWVIAICYLTKKNPAYAEPNRHFSSLPNVGLLQPREAYLCAKWYISPDTFMAIKRRIDEASFRTRSQVVRLTPGDLRIISGIDIFRSCALWEYLCSEGKVANPIEKLYSYLVFDDE